MIFKQNSYEESQKNNNRHWIIIRIKDYGAPEV